MHHTRPEIGESLQYHRSWPTRQAISFGWLWIALFPESKLRKLCHRRASLLPLTQGCFRLARSVWNPDALLSFLLPPSFTDVLESQADSAAGSDLHLRLSTAKSDRTAVLCHSLATWVFHAAS